MLLIRTADKFSSHDAVVEEEANRHGACKGDPLSDSVELASLSLLSWPCWFTEVMPVFVSGPLTTGVLVCLPLASCSIVFVDTGRRVLLFRRDDFTPCPLD